MKYSYALLSLGFGMTLCVGSLLAAPANEKVDTQPQSDTRGYEEGTQDSHKDRMIKTNDSLTPMDQSQKQQFLDRTAAIRSDLMDQDDLSTSAKNIKVITAENGNVYLRGEVSTTKEKQMIERIARNHVGNGSVESQITVTR